MTCFVARARLIFDVVAELRARRFREGAAVAIKHLCGFYARTPDGRSFENFIVPLFLPIAPASRNFPEAIEQLRAAENRVPPVSRAADSTADLGSRLDSTRV